MCNEIAKINTGKLNHQEQSKTYNEKVTEIKKTTFPAILKNIPLKYYFLCNINFLFQS